METERFYRKRFNAGNLSFFRACVDQTDLYIGASRNLEKEALEQIKKYRSDLVDYIRRDSRFHSSLVPIKPKENAPLIVFDMCNAATLANVGPMAAVAGAFSKFVGQALLKYSDEIIVENGGDIFIKSNIDRNVGIYAGNSPLSNKIAVRLSHEKTPCGICTSSGTVGHSLSFGKADAALVIHPDASVSDACATALGNRVKRPEDIEAALEFISKIPGVCGALVIVGEALGAIGDIELCEFE
jgi:ApbE superfamily uncharacterized protein (UPF0280 family)